MTWASKTLYPLDKHLPIYAPNEFWEVVTLGRLGELPKPPPGVATYWWKLPKDQWPYQTPWATKQFGTLLPMTTMMREDHKHHFPPLGVIKQLMPGQQIPQGQQISFQKIRMHMRHLSPDEMRVKMKTPFGHRYYVRNEKWDRQKNGPFVKVEKDKPRAKDLFTD